MESRLNGWLQTLISTPTSLKRGVNEKRILPHGFPSTSLISLQLPHPLHYIARLSLHRLDRTSTFFLRSEVPRPPPRPSRRHALNVHRHSACQANRASSVQRESRRADSLCLCPRALGRCHESVRTSHVRPRCCHLPRVRGPRRWSRRYR